MKTTAMLYYRHIVPLPSWASFAQYDKVLEILSFMNHKDLLVVLIQRSEDFF